MTISVDELVPKLRMFAQVGRERRSNVALNQYHAEVLDEAASQLIAMKEALAEARAAIVKSVRGGFEIAGYSAAEADSAIADWSSGSPIIRKIDTLLTSEGTAP